MDGPPFSGGEAPPIALVGVGSSDQFALAEAIDKRRIKWRGAFKNFAALAAAGPGTASVVLLDGDAVATDLIELLDQNLPILSKNAVILQISTSPVRLVVSAMQRGVTDVLVKPFTAVRLDAALKDALIVCERRTCVTSV